MIVSIYKNVSKTEGSTVNLFDVLTTDKWKHLSDKVRAEKDKAKRDKLKQQLLPAFTPSGVFKENERKDEGLIKHSGMMCIDIDGDDNPNIKDWENVIFQLGKLPEVAFAGLSVSGNGVFAIIPIKYPNRHKEHFKAFQKSFEKRGLVIDPKCGNVSRLRFYSYNKKYHINRNAKPYIPVYEKPKPSIATATSFQSDVSDVEALVREIEMRGVVIVPDYDSWFNVGAALSNVHNGRDLFHRISRVDASKYDYKMCNKQFDSIKPGRGISISTLFHTAKQFGVTVSSNKNSSTNGLATKAASVRNGVCNNDNPDVSAEGAKETSKEKTEYPKHQEQKTVCYVDADGKLYIPNRCDDVSYTVYKKVEDYNNRNHLPTFIARNRVDVSQMEKRYINSHLMVV